MVVLNSNFLNFYFHERQFQGCHRLLQLNRGDRGFEQREASLLGATVDVQRQKIRASAPSHLQVGSEKPSHIQVGIEKPSRYSL